MHSSLAIRSEFLASLIYFHNLMQVVTVNGSELLLNNAERYGLVLARAVEAPRRLSRPNIGMTLVFIMHNMQAEYE